jgi:hypothetical protein
MNKIKKIVIYIVSISIVIVLFLGFQRLVMPKYDGSEDMPLEGNFTSEYYKETTNHDVIMVGDCEVYENIDTMYLWKNYGITSYIRGNAQQLTWQSYYMLEDTLKYETPKVVIYNVQALQHSEPQKETYNRMTLDGMKWSKTKIDAIKASMCEGEQFIEYLFPLLRYHSRITSLTESDFKYYFNSKQVTHNGYYMRIDTLPLSQSDVADDSWLLGDDEDDDDIWDDFNDDTEEEGEEFGELPMKYLDKIRELCSQNNIQLILMKAPSLSPIWYDYQNQQVEEYAEEYDLTYINFYDLIDEIGIDYETDTYDGGLHMNLSGADKISKYLGRILTSQYEIEDKRNDDEISKVYEEKYQFYLDMIKAQEKELETYGEIRSY